MNCVAKFNVVKLDWYGQNKVIEHKTAVDLGWRRSSCFYNVISCFSQPRQALAGDNHVTRLQYVLDIRSETRVPN